MLTVKELRPIVTTMGLKDFEIQLGPFVLLELPPSEQVQQAALQLGAARTVVQPEGKKDALSLLLQFDQLRVATLPPLGAEASLLVGRMPDCDLLVEDPSVSKHHARLTWNQAKKTTTISDLGSSNGTRVNGAVVLPGTAGARTLKDGDAVIFGDARFLFHLTRTLHAKLSRGGW